MAGMKVRRLVNEPTAAAVYYAQTQGVRGRVLVFDMGGGTLDVTILEVEGEDFRILTSEGARHLGGGNIDEMLLDIYAEQYRNQVRPNSSAQRQRRRVLHAAEDAKKMLSKLQRVNDTIGNDTNGIGRIELTRENFERVVQRLLTRADHARGTGPDQRETAAADIDHVVLVGGSTRIPKVKAAIERFFGKPPKSCGNVDEAVALGAAIFAQANQRASAKSAIRATAHWPIS